MSHGYYPPMPVQPYYQSSMNYQEQYHYPSSNVSYDQQQMEPPRNSGFLDYVFGGARHNDDQSESGDFDPTRHSTMW